MTERSGGGSRVPASIRQIERASAKPSAKREPARTVARRSSVPQSARQAERGNPSASGSGGGTGRSSVAPAPAALNPWVLERLGERASPEPSPSGSPASPHVGPDFTTEDQVIRFEDRVLDLSTDPGNERLIEQLIHPGLGRPLTDAEITEVIDSAGDRVRSEATESADFTTVIHVTTGTNPDATLLLETGNYDDQLLVANRLDLDAVERTADVAADGENHVLLQTVYDPVVSGKTTTVDEYSIGVRLPPDLSPEAFLAEMAADMDGVLGGEFAAQADFRNHGGTPVAGQVIEIDVEDPGLPFIDPDLSPFNAPVILTRVEDDRFSVQTIELNTQEHGLHGTREWGFEELPNGSTRFYTRAISVEDNLAAELGGRRGERELWTSWTDRVGDVIEDRGGAVVENSEVAIQTDGPTGDQLWGSLTPVQQDIVRDTQLGGFEREATRLESERDARFDDFASIPGIELVPGHEAVIEAIEAGEPASEILGDLYRMAAGGNLSYETATEIRVIADVAGELDGRAEEIRDEAKVWAAHRS